MNKDIPSRPVTPANSEDETLLVDAVLYKELRVPPPEDPENFSKTSLRNELQNIRLGHNGDKVIFGNSEGESLLARLTATEKKFETSLSKDRITTQRIEKLERKVDENAMEIGSLKAHLRQYMQSSDNYLSIRRRFLEVYQRDVKGGEFRDHKAIQKGNIVAHEGDALGDAMVYTRDGRQDRKLFRELYGLDHTQVLEYYNGANDGGLYLVLNAHATLLAKGDKVSDELKLAFDSFIDNVEMYWSQPPNSDPNSPLGRAYYTFWKHHKDKGR